MVFVTDSSVADFLNSLMQNRSGTLPKVPSNVQDKDGAAELNYSLYTQERLRF